MDWITTSGTTLDEAKSNALDQLGIVADEAEFDVVNDVQKGLFGRVKVEAKVRARVRPRQPAAKDERRSRNGGNRNRNRNRNRSGKSQGGNNNGGNNRNSGKSSNNNGGAKSKSNENNRSKAGNGNGSKSSNQNNNKQGNKQGGRRNDGNGQKGSGNAAAAATVGSEKVSGKKETMEATVTREEQEEVAFGFLEGVLTSFGMTGSVALVEEEADDGAIELAVSGEELGLLVGPKGNTLSALQELTRTVVQRNAEGAKTDRLRVDVAGYRMRRTAALGEFAQKLATEVAESGNEKLLEPMSAADRKVVHDAISEVDGVETGSEGQEPRRRVVIRPVS